MDSFVCSIRAFVAFKNTLANNVCLVTVFKLNIQTVLSLIDICRLVVESSEA